MPHRHPDLDVPLELRRQTAHKLELMRRYWGTWCSILAQARGHAFCVNGLWLIDCMAGRGHHVSTTMQGGVRLGTAGSAAREAVLTQRRFPDVTVHLRAIEIDEILAAQLDARMDRFRGVPPDKIDVRVLPGDFGDWIPKVIEEVAEPTGHLHSSIAHGGRPHQHRSLWLIDPYGSKDIPHSKIEPLQRLVGAEAIINLDVGGLLRVGAAAEAQRMSASEMLSRIGRADAARMDETFGGSAWVDILRSNPAQPYQALAEGYANTFPLFDHRNAYMLWASGSQYRAIVQYGLALQKKAGDAVAVAFNARLRKRSLEPLSEPE